MEDLVESILDYVRADYTDYAIMINGEWGSGKTHFWNNKIRKKIDSMKFNGKQYKTIYMSLYGISNLEDISKKIFIETTQLMDKNLKKYMNQHEEMTIPEYAKTGLDMANLFGVSANEGKIDYEEFFSTDDKVLCFDDLERANVDVIDILGYINNFVEHDHIKTIIICNEKELSTKIKSSNLEMKTFIATYILDKEGELQDNNKPMVEKIKDQIENVFDKANDYERIKEKLIGETFEYAPKFDYIINGILIRYEDDPDLERFYRTNINLIISTFKKSGTRNLRILKHALKDFQKIYQVVTQKYPDISNRVIQTMLIFTIAISFEIKAGKVTTLPNVNTIADGTAVKTPGEKIFPYIQKNLDDIITVDDDELVVAFLDMVENHKMVIENSGLLTVAALKHLNVKAKRVVSILSGGNMDVITMSSVVQQGLIFRDRIFTVSVLLPDKPGELSRVADTIAKEQGNVIKLEHNQFVSINRSAAVELRITLEAFGTDHKKQIMKALEKNGYKPKLVRTNL